MEKQVFKSVPKLNDRQLEKQTQNQIEFLKIIHPSLEDEDNWNEGAIELRPIKRDENSKDFVRSYNTWHLQEKDIQALRRFLGSINGKGFCLHYSGFAFDRNKVVIKSNGNPYEKGKINNDNALFTTILPMDFDGITEEEFSKEKQKLLELGIETLDIFSGHGFQSIILLSQRVLDKGIYKKFTELLISKGLKVDSALIDPARQLRMPYSFNSKALDKKDKYYDPMFPEIIPTTVRNWTEKRYQVIDVLKKINSLPDLIVPVQPLLEREIESISIAPITEVLKKPKKRKQIIQQPKEIKIESIKSVYSTLINIDLLPEPIRKMLAGSQDGLRNSVMMFLIPFLRNGLNLKPKTIQRVMVLWGERCNPKLDSEYVIAETKRIYGYGIKGKHGRYSEELRKVYGYLEFEKYKRDNKIIIPNAFFEDFDVLSDGAVKIYFSMKLGEKIEQIKEFTKKDIQNYTCISERTLERNIKDLVNMGHVTKRRSKNRRAGEEHTFYLNPYFSTKYGFTTLENSLVRLALKTLTNGEMKIYSYLCRMVGSVERDCWASQAYIGKKVRKTQQGVSLITEQLKKKGFINKTTEEKDGVKHCIYNLNY